MNDLQTRTSGGEVKLRQCENYRHKLCTDLSERASHIERHLHKYNDIATELTRFRQQHISDLITYIFPISELPAKTYVLLCVVPLHKIILFYITKMLCVALPCSIYVLMSTFKRNKYWFRPVFYEKPQLGFSCFCQKKLWFQFYLLFFCC